MEQCSTHYPTHIEKSALMAMLRFQRSERRSWGIGAHLHQSICFYRTDAHFPESFDVQSGRHFTLQALHRSCIFFALSHQPFRLAQR
jgi:hypothetical protein